MAPDKNRYFIGIIPPSPIYEKALELKNYFKEHYASKASLNSPPHITLHMPFEWKISKEESLLLALKNLATSLSPCKVELRNFDSFAPRVIFIKAIPSEPLLSIQHKLRQFCKKELGLFNADYRELPFHPHITLAFRDLKKTAFSQAWEEFSKKSFDAEFVADQMCLLKHDGKSWGVYREFVLEG